MQPEASNCESGSDYPRPIQPPSGQDSEGPDGSGFEPGDICLGWREIDPRTSQAAAKSDLTAVDEMGDDGLHLVSGFRILTDCFHEVEKREVVGSFHGWSPARTCSWKPVFALIKKQTACQMQGNAKSLI